MLWFTVWTVLAVVAVGALFLAGRQAWRSGTALLDELGRAGDVLARLEERAEELAAEAPLHPVAAVDLGDTDAARVRLAAARLARDRRRAARAARHEATYARWRAFSR